MPMGDLRVKVEIYNAGLHDVAVVSSQLVAGNLKFSITEETFTL